MTGLRRIIRACVVMTMLWTVGGMTACSPGGMVRGVVMDMKGEALPGVSVILEGNDTSSLTNALGKYSLWCPKTGKRVLHFMKTGYTPGLLTLEEQSAGRETPVVRLWPLPDGEGVYFLQQMRYAALDHPKPARYIVEGIGPAFGTAVTPKSTAAAPFGGPEVSPGEPVLMAHKLPAYDAKISKLRSVKASIPQSGSSTASAGPSAKSGEPARNYSETVWIAETTASLVCRPVDEPGRMLVELLPPTRLEPGVYAVHWGALEGLSGLESRLFLFRIPDKEKAEGEVKQAPAASESPENKSKSMERERKEHHNDVEKETGEGMG